MTDRERDLERLVISLMASAKSAGVATPLWTDTQDAFSLSIERRTNGQLVAILRVQPRGSERFMSLQYAVNTSIDLFGPEIPYYTFTEIANEENR